jgi:hypothetical protein
MVALLAVAISLQIRSNAPRLEQERKEAEQERKKAEEDAEEQFRPYREAWAVARTSDNLDIFTRCGDYLIKAARQWQPQLVESVAWDVYRETLQRLRTRPDLKPVALETGRAAYAARRAGGVLTIYDEQAIQNDIFAHSG